MVVSVPSAWAAAMSSSMPPAAAAVVSVPPPAVVAVPPSAVVAGPPAVVVAAVPPQAVTNSPNTKRRINFRFSCASFDTVDGQVNETSPPMPKRSPCRLGFRDVHVLAATSLAWPPRGPSTAPRGECLHRDHPLRRHQVRGRQTEWLFEGGPATADIVLAPDVVWLYTPDLLRRGGGSPMSGCHRRRRRPPRYLRDLRAPDRPSGHSLDGPSRRRLPNPRSGRGGRQGGSRPQPGPSLGRSGGNGRASACVG